MQQFFYDGQIRRFLLQFTRIFSNFQVEFGQNQAGVSPPDTLVRVPVRYGDASRNAQTIIQQNSANSMPATPLMTFYIVSLDYDRGRIQEPYFVDKINVRQRYYDTETETYEVTQANAFTIERMMPVPYKLTLNLDIWTSNTNQKMQLLEQILTLFNPSLEIQSTDNYIDWTSLSVVELESVTWSSRSIPQGTDDQIDICTLRFGLPIWISPPAKIKKLGVVERIIMSVYDAQGDASNAVLDSDLLLGTRLKVTPYSYQVLLLNGQLQILHPQDVISEPNTSTLPPNSPVDDELVWPSVIDLYGSLRPGISYVTLDNPWEPDTQIVGTVAINPADDRFLLFNVDPATIPANTLSPIDAIINPLLSAPGDGLDSSLTGQRYLFTEATGSADNYNEVFNPETFEYVPFDANPKGWRGLDGQPLIANANDIVEYDGNRWRVVFDSVNQGGDIQYVTNITTGIQYKWIPLSTPGDVPDGQWVKSYDGLYPGGSWNLIL
jgi:hypothetical protein